MEKSYWVYILTNKSFTLYVGITSNLQKRIWEHRNKLIEGFTKRYNLAKLIYVEGFRDVNQALAREKQIKSWSRQKKIDLIKSENQDFKEIYL